MSSPRTALHIVAWLLTLAAIAGAFSRRAALADSPVPARVEATDDPEAVLNRALDLERAHQWVPALQIYEEALTHWPGRVDFRHRMRLCESHYRLGRRYQDASFRQVLLSLSPDQALELLDEVLERIESHYVEAVHLAPLLRRGLDNIEVGLRDPLFLAANAPRAEQERLLALRKRFQADRGRLSVQTRAAARAHVIAWCKIAHSEAQISATPLIFEFIYGACDALDDYSCYLSPNKLDDLYAVIDGNFVGLGVELKTDPEGLFLVAVIPGGPAAAAGLRAGERITRINGASIAGQGLDEAASKLQGPEQSTVDLTVRDKGQRERSLRLTRRPVEVRSVAQARIVDAQSGVGYVHLSGFQKSSTEELRRAVVALQRQGMRYLVLDLRGNPGGLLDIAVELADDFLDSGVIVSTRGRAENQSALYRARPGTLWNLPMAVLLDHDSASASEILAGALKDNQRAVVLGEQSYGKGSVQSIFPLRSAPAGLKLTTAKFFSPRDVAYSEHGVMPDVAVRSSARPAGNAGEFEFEAGDPEHDPVLQRAIAQAQRAMAATRR